MIDVWIDELTLCLKDTQTGEIVDTEVIKITRKSFLQKYNKKNGWYENWARLSDDNDIFALVIKGTVDIQGMVAIREDKLVGMPYLAWAVAAPQNVSLGDNKRRYEGVGGHLFAVAADYSLQHGYDGEFYGFASCEELVNHYCRKLGAQFIGMLHPYHIYIPADAATKLKEEYTYEWTNDVL